MAARTVLLVSFAALVGVTVLWGDRCFAEIYSCKDASGRTISSDRPIAECADRERRVLNEDGSVQKVIAPPLTPEQRRKKEEEEVRQEAEKRREAEQRRKDQALLATYRSEKELEAAFERALSVPTEGAKASHFRINALRAQLDKILLESEFYVGKPWPPALKRKLSEVQGALDAEVRNIDDKAAEIERVNAKFKADLERFRNLTSAEPPKH
jgi:hypothetical protein